MKKTVIGIMLLFATVGAAESNRDSNSLKIGPVLRGTINVIAANENGIVALTDSMVTEESVDEHGARHSRQLAEPGQKLFRIDDQTVCTIAGFASAGTPALPDFLNNSSAIMGRYESRLRSVRGPISVALKLDLLRAVFSHYLEGTADIRAVANSADDYFLELLIAGYDPDGTPEIGDAILKLIPESGPSELMTFRAQTVDIKVAPVRHDTPPLVSGKTELALRILRDPTDWSTDAAVAGYADAHRTGKPMTIEQLKALAISLKQHTADTEREVGGPSQIAVLTQGRIQSIEQPPFPPIAETDFKFAIITTLTFKNDRSPFEGHPTGVAIGAFGTSFTSAGAAYSVGPGVFPIIVANSFFRVMQPVDDAYFSNNSFRESILRYDGGTTRFEKSNRVIDCYLEIGAQVKRDSPVAASLLRDFRWSKILDSRYPSANGKSSER